MFPASMIDLHQAFLPAGRAVLHGHSPHHAAYARFDEIRSAYGSLKKESRGGEGLQSSPPRFDSDPRRRVER